VFCQLLDNWSPVFVSANGRRGGSLLASELFPRNPICADARVAQPLPGRDVIRFEIADPQQVGALFCAQTLLPAPVGQCELPSGRVGRDGPDFFILTKERKPLGIRSSVGLLPTRCRAHVALMPLCRRVIRHGDIGCGQKFLAVALESIDFALQRFAHRVFGYRGGCCLRGVCC
jgi:hypothetical protein